MRCPQGEPKASHPEGGVRRVAGLGGGGCVFVRVVGTSSFWFPGDFWKCDADVTAAVIEHLNVAPVNKQYKRKESLAYCGLQGVLRKYLF